MNIIYENKKAFVTEYNSLQTKIVGCQCFKDCNCSEKKNEYKKEHYYYVKSLKGKKGLKTYNKSEAINRFNFLTNL